MIDNTLSSNQGTNSNININMNPKIFTVFITVGPIKCGKTYFLTEFMNRLDMKSRETLSSLSVGQPNKIIDQLKFRYLSTSDINKELSSSSSTIARSIVYKTLYQRLETYIRYPVRSHFVAIDATSLSLSPDDKGKVSSIFLDRIKEICDRNQYSMVPIVFNFQHHAMYYPHDQDQKNPISSIEKDLIKSQIKNLKNNILPNLSMYPQKIIIKNNCQWKIIEFSDQFDDQFRQELLNYQRCFLPNNGHKNKYLIIGDVHESVNTFKKLIIESGGFDIDPNGRVTLRLLREQEQKDKEKRDDDKYPNRIIQVGDLFDKGGQTIEMLKFVNANLDNDDIFTWIRGNHEKKLLQLILNPSEVEQLEKMPEYSSILKYCFTAYKQLFADEKKDYYINIFKKYMIKTVPWCYYHGNHLKSWYVTHAPCDQKYLGKMDHESHDAQMNFYLQRNNIEQSSAKIKNLIQQENNKYGYPLHIVGHMNLNEMVKRKYLDNEYLKSMMKSNKCGYLFIDTIAENKLSAAIMNNTSSSPFRIISVPIDDHDKSHFINIPTVDNNSIDSMNENKEILLVTVPETKETKETKNIIVDKNPVMNQIHPEVEKLIKNKIKFISGTIAPSNADHKTNEIENCTQAIEYYRKQFEINNQNNSRIILQVKDMGSRAQLYLNVRDPDRSYMVSRNGHLIKNNDKDFIKLIVAPIVIKFKNYFEKENIVEIIFDGELMPWSTLGNNLINNQFGTIDASLDLTIRHLEKSGFQQVFDRATKLMHDHPCYMQMQMERKSTITNYVTTSSSKDQTKDQTKDNCKGEEKKIEIENKDQNNNIDKFSNKFPKHVRNNFEILSERKMSAINVDKMKEYWQEYHNQLNIFNRPQSPHDNSPHLKIFNILKYKTFNVETNAFEEHIPTLENKSAIDIYQLVSDNEYCIIDFNDDDEKITNKINQFWHEITEVKKFEGIVVKPEFYSSNHDENENVKKKMAKMAPYLKVRNPKYLHLIYGYDFLSKRKQKKLIKTKDNRKKIRNSIDEFEWSLQVLQVKDDDFNLNNLNLIKLLSQWFNNDRKNDDNNVDPRL